MTRDGVCGPLLVGHLTVLTGTLIGVILYFMQVRDLLEIAIKRAGSEAKLGKLAGYTQNAIWQAKERGTITAEMAVAIDRATDGAVTKEMLRPDLFNSEAAAS